MKKQSLTTSHQQTATKSLSNDCFLKTSPPVLLLIVMLYDMQYPLHDMEYPLGRLGSAVLAMSPHSHLATLNPLTVGAR